MVSLILQKVHDEGIDEENDEMFRYRFSSHLINHLVYSLLEYSKHKVHANGGVLSAVIDAKQEIPIGMEKELETQIKKLKKLLFTKLYQSKEITRKMFAGKQAIKGLYNALMEDEKILPVYYRELLKPKNSLHVRAKHRVVADYIASMSDRYALKLYNELYGRI